MCDLSLIYQLLLVITCHFKQKKAYGIAIHTQKLISEKKWQRVFCITYYEGFLTAVREEHITKWQNPK